MGHLSSDLKCMTKYFCCCGHWPMGVYIKFEGPFCCSFQIDEPSDRFTTLFLKKYFNIISDCFLTEWVNITSSLLTVQFLLYYTFHLSKSVWWCWRYADWMKLQKWFTSEPQELMSYRLMLWLPVVYGCWEKYR